MRVTIGEVGGDNKGKGFRNYYKGHMDKPIGEDGSKGGRWVWPGEG